MTLSAKFLYSNLPRRYFRIGLAFVCVALAGFALSCIMTSMSRRTRCSTAGASWFAPRSTAAFSMARPESRRRRAERPRRDGRGADDGSTQRDVRAGRARRTGRQLAALDSERGRLETLQAQLQMEVSRFTDLSLARANAELQAAHSNVESADSAYRVAHADADRARKMIGTGSMGASEIDQKIGAEEEAKHKLAAAQADLARLMVEAGAFAPASMRAMARTTCPIRANGSTKSPSG